MVIVPVDLNYEHLSSTEDGCQNTWEQFKDSGNCYQLNTQAALSWKAAYLSCKKQGSDLVSITSASELNYIRGKYNFILHSRGKLSVKANEK